MKSVRQPRGLSRVSFLYQTNGNLYQSCPSATWVLQACVYVCLYVCMYVFMYVGKYICVCMCVCVYMSLWTDWRPAIVKQSAPNLCEPICSQPCQPIHTQSLWTELHAAWGKLRGGNKLIIRRRRTERNTNKTNYALRFSGVWKLELMSVACERRRLSVSGMGSASTESTISRHERRRLPSA